VRLIYVAKALPLMVLVSFALVCPALTSSYLSRQTLEVGVSGQKALIAMYRDYHFPIYLPLIQRSVGYVWGGIIATGLIISAVPGIVSRKGYGRSISLVRFAFSLVVCRRGVVVVGVSGWPAGKVFFPLCPDYAHYGYPDIVGRRIPEAFRSCQKTFFSPSLVF